MKSNKYAGENNQIEQLGSEGQEKEQTVSLGQLFTNDWRDMGLTYLIEKYYSRASTDL